MRRREVGSRAVGKEEEGSQWSAKNDRMRIGMELADGENRDGLGAVRKAE